MSKSAAFTSPVSEASGVKRIVRFHDRLPNKAIFERILSNFRKLTSPKNTDGSSNAKPKRASINTPIPDPTSAMNKPKAKKMA